MRGQINSFMNKKAENSIDAAVLSADLHTSEITSFDMIIIRKQQ